MRRKKISFIAVHVAVFALTLLILPVNPLLAGSKALYGSFATLAGASSVSWYPQLSYAYDSIELTVIGPGGFTFSHSFSGSSTPTLHGPLPDGQYTYELRVAPMVDADTRAAIAAARESGDSTLLFSSLARAVPLGPTVQSGSFRISSGVLVSSDAVEQ
jgi:hypothetical protein